MNRLFDRLPFIGGRIPGKITLSLLMLLLAMILALFVPTLDRIFCIFAMFFSFFGDITLNSSKKSSGKLLLVGGLFFIVAHLFYALAYANKISEMQFAFFNHGVIFSVVVLVLATFIVLSQKPRLTALLAFGVIYLWLTGIDYTIICSYAYSSNSVASLSAAGAIMFLASDVIIGLERFTGLKSKTARELVWWLYPIGQTLIIIFA